jgi:hypothetical protein
MTTTVSSQIYLTRVVPSISKQSRLVVSRGEVMFGEVLAIEEVLSKGRIRSKNT